MQADQVVGQADGLQRRARVAMDKTVGIRTCYGNDQCAIWKCIGKLLNRLCTAPGMQGHHQIRFLPGIGNSDLNPVPKCPQYPSPPRGCSAITGS